METQSTAHNIIFAARFIVLVERLYEAKNITGNGNNQTVESTISNCFAGMAARNHSGKRQTFRDLLLLMYTKKCYGVIRNPAYIEVLANMSAFGKKAVNPIETWIKDSLTADGQLASLIRHMFARYEVPEFMEYAFAESNKIHMLWYIQLGRGESVQQLSALPVAFTKKMAHAFRDTPKQFTIVQAIRRAQAAGFGATGPMAEAIAWLDSVEQLADKDFRASVIHFLANYKGVVAFDVVQQMVGYIVVQHTRDDSYSLKGRTFASISREAAAYHIAEAKRLSAALYNNWKPAKVGNYNAAKDDNVYSVIQLTNSEALYNEGVEMSHCVADYVYDCEIGQTAIFSLRKFTEGAAGYETLATLEVAVAEREVVQAKARFNNMLAPEAKMYMMKWARRENLTVGYEVFEYYNHNAPEHVVAPPVPQPVLPIAEMPRIVPRYNAEEAYRRRAPVQEAKSFDVDPATLAKIILLIIKILVVVSRCS